MRLRVLDDDRPGYAQLAFDSALSQPTIGLSVYSQQEGGFLGPDGTWRKAAHFFTAAKIASDTQSALYRVGPEVVNYLRELDLVEFAAQDGSFRVETTWENAVPEMVRRQGSRSIYRDSRAPLVAAPLVGRSFNPKEPHEPEPPVQPSAEPLAPEPAPEPPVEALETPSEPQSEPVAPPPQPHGPPSPQEPTALVPHPEDAPPQPEIVPKAASEPADDFDPAPPPRKSTWVYWLAALGVIGLALLGFGLYQFLPCEWFGESHCTLQDDTEAANIAKACATRMSQDGLDCDIGKACIVPYRTGFPRGKTRPDIEKTATSADEVCKQMVDKARGVHQCIDDLKASGRSRCDVQQTCIDPFQQRFPKGPLRAEVDAAAQLARDDCAKESHPVSPAAEEEALSKARQCVTDDAKKCALPGCYAAYLHAYGLVGIHKDEAQSEAVKLDQDCLDEEATLQTARDCAADSAHKCAQPRCYAEYQSTYGLTGIHKNEARNEAAKLDNECDVVRKQSDEDSAWQSAGRCAASATACAVVQCYDPYRTKYCPAGAHCAAAQIEITRAAQNCRPPPLPPSTQAAVEGRYSARSSAACGAKVDYSIVVDVKGGRISWEHEFLGVKYLWEGTIDAYGKVTAKVANFPGYTATGQFDKDATKEIQMKYPHCNSGVVPLEIRAKIQ
jgi:hypothetical protein